MTDKLYFTLAEGDGVLTKGAMVDVVAFRTVGKCQLVDVAVHDPDAQLIISDKHSTLFVACVLLAMLFMFGFGFLTGAGAS